MKVLITGAGGYIGGMLLEKLAREDDVDIRAFLHSRRDYLEKSYPEVNFFYGDALSREDVAESLEGIDCVYYLIHSMGTRGDFESEDRQAAINFREECNRAGVKKIIYLGGLYQDENPSAHMRSRQEVGDILRESRAKLYEFRASVVIGAGSLSFEMIRSLVEKLPIMLCPRWVRQKAQPIFVSDLIAYLRAALFYDDKEDRIFEVGGSERCSYQDIMLFYAELRHLKRRLVPVPVLTPYLSSLWLGLVTPLYAGIGRKLIGSIRSQSLVEDNQAEEIFNIEPISCHEALRRAIVAEDNGYTHCKWNLEREAAGIKDVDFNGAHFGNRLVDSRLIFIAKKKSEVFSIVRSIGGDNGWYYGDFLWNLRGFIDLLVGGPGIRRGRRHPTEIHVGDVIDWWRVEDFEDDALLLLQAEMKVPGRAWLKYEIEDAEGGCYLRQTAIFDPLGLFGLLYWYSIMPLHNLIFNGMLRNIKIKALHKEEQD